MRILWNYIDRLDWTKKAKVKLLLLLVSLVSAVIGLGIWGIVQLWCLKTWDWMLCFILYPVFAAWISVFLYSCRHSFHTGANIQTASKIHQQKHAVIAVAQAE